MKKALIGLAIAIVVALVIALVAGGPDGKAPRVGAALDAKHTVGLLSYENLDQMAARGVAIIEGLPPSLKSQAPMLSVDGIETYLGFNPASTSAWSASGFDPTSGVSVVVDSRVRSGPNAQPTPMGVAKIDDRDKLAAFVGKLGASLSFGAEQDGVTLATLAGQQFWMGERKGFSFFLEPPRGNTARQAALKAQFVAFLKADGPALSSHSDYREAFAYAGGGGRISGYGASAALADLLEGEVPLSKTDIKYYTDRFSAAGLSFADNGISGRMIASTKGVSLLNKLLRAKKSSRLARFVPAQGWAVVRTAANIPQFFDGLSELIPPSMSTERASLGMSKMAMAFMGFSYDDLSASFTGFAMGALDLDSVLDAAMGKGSSPRWLAALGVANAERAARVLDTLTEWAAKMGSRTAVEAAGGKGYRLGLQGMSMVVILVDDAILIAPDLAGVEKAVETADGTHLGTTRAGKRIDDSDAFFASSFDATTVMNRLEKGDFPIPKNGANELLLSAVSKLDVYQALRKEPVTFSLLLDGGVRMESSLAMDPTTHRMHIRSRHKAR